MERQEKLQQLADEKLLGQLKNEQDFEQELANSPELAEMLDDTALAMEAIDAAEDAALKTRLQNLEAGLSSKKPERHLRVVREADEGAVVRPLKTSFFRRNMMAIAASLLFLLAAGYYFLMPNTSNPSADLYAANFAPYENIAVNLTRSNDPSPEEIAFTAYEDEDFEKAAQLLTALGDKPTYNFYAAQAYLADEKYAAAERLLRPIANAPASPLFHEANWYLALADLGAGKTAAAKNRLNTIAATEKSPYAEQAREMVGEL